MPSHLDQLLKDIGAPNLSQAARASILQLWEHIPGQPDMQDELELVVYAGVLLHEQNRIQDVLSAHAGGDSGHGLQKHELIWAALYPHLRRCGYRLSARYAPGWRYPGRATVTPLDDEQPDAEAEPLEKYSYRAIPATRISTGEETVVKILFRRPGHPSAREQDILQFLNAPPQRADPRNVCVPVREFLDCPAPASGTYSMVVMPSLTGCETLTKDPVESLDILRQALHGLAFLHEHGIAHRDLCCLNTMFSRDESTQRPRLYFIDFGLATWFAPGPGTASRRVRWNEARTPLPERASEYDAFKADVYACGAAFQPCMFRALRDYFPLYCLMTAHPPDERPSASECLQLFDVILASSPWRGQVPTDDFPACTSPEHKTEYTEQLLAPVPPSHPFLTELVL